MSSSLEQWMAEVSGAVAALGDDLGPEIARPSDASLSREVAEDGYPGVLPLWAGARVVVGLDARPDAEFARWPGVILQGGQALTLASDARTVLPQLLVNRMLSNDPESAEQLSRLWGPAADRALALHRALGGDDEALQAVIAAASDAATRQAFKYREDALPEFQAAHSRLFRQVDGSDAFARYADWLDACIAGRCAPPDDSAAFGPWEHRVLALSARNRFASPAPRLTPAQLLRLVEENAGVDSGIPRKPSWLADTGGGSGEAGQYDAAMALQTEPEPDDPVSAAIRTALLTEGPSYRGLAHAEAVPALDEGGQPERAWGALKSAAWWAARNAGGVPPALLEGARFLAGRHGWTDVAWVVERAAGPA